MNDARTASPLLSIDEAMRRLDAAIISAHLENADEHETLIDAFEALARGLRSAEFQQ